MQLTVLWKGIQTEISVMKSNWKKLKYFDPELSVCKILVQNFEKKSGKMEKISKDLLFQDLDFRDCPLYDDELDEFFRIQT